MHQRHAGGYLNFLCKQNLILFKTSNSFTETSKCYIQEETNMRELVQKAHAKTTLTAFFKLNQNDPEARSMLYQQTMLYKTNSFLE